MKMKKSIWIIVCIVVLAALCSLAVACDKLPIASEQKEEKTLDFGTVYAMAEEAGYQGTLEELIAAFKGDDAYQIAVKNGYKGTETEWLASLRGAAGAEGCSPTIGENKHWYIGDVDTGVMAEGKAGKDGKDGDPGKDGLTPEIGENNHWYIGEKDTGVIAEGKDGVTPTIGENKHWYIGDVDTGITAEGKDATAPTIAIDAEGYWVINGVTLDVKARGENGKDSVWTVDEEGYLIINDEKMEVRFDTNPHTHTYGDWIVIKENTCLEQGFRTKACTECGYVIGEYLASLGHSVVVIDAVEPTCSQAGRTRMSYCDRCYDLFEEATDIPALGHQWDENGTCTRCGKTNLYVGLTIPADFKIGLICLHDESATYDLNFINAAKEAVSALGMSESQLIIKTGIAESPVCYDAAIDLVYQGCKVIFADSFGHESYMIQAAREFPNVQFCHATGVFAHTEGLANFHNAYASIDEGRYLTGVAAGMKLNEMNEGKAENEKNYKVGYVGAYSYAEVISAYTAFYLGVKSVCPEATMEVQYSGSWYDVAMEKRAAENLISRGCALISQHADSMGAPSVCEKAGIPNVPYNGSTIAACPDTFLISGRIDWMPYVMYIIAQTVEGKAIATDYVGSLADGSVEVSALGNCAAAGTQEKLEEVKEKLINGTLKVFDTSAFTVTVIPADPNGYDFGLNVDATVDEHGKLVACLADVDESNWDFTPDTQVVIDGEFKESYFRSAPYFYLRIDGITELNWAY